MPTALHTTGFALIMQ